MDDSDLPTHLSHFGRSCNPMVKIGPVTSPTPFSCLVQIHNDYIFNECILIYSLPLHVSRPNGPGGFTMLWYNDTNVSSKLLYCTLMELRWIHLISLRLCMCETYFYSFWCKCISYTILPRTGVYFC